MRKLTAKKIAYIVAQAASRSLRRLTRRSAWKTPALIAEMQRSSLDGSAPSLEHQRQPQLPHASIARTSLMLLCHARAAERRAAQQAIEHASPAPSLYDGVSVPVASRPTTITEAVRARQRGCPTHSGIGKPRSTGGQRRGSGAAALTTCTAGPLWQPWQSEATQRGLDDDHDNPARR